MPTLVDDASDSVAQSFGLTYFPFTVFVDSSGIVLGRVVGAIPIDDMISIIGQMS